MDENYERHEDGTKNGGARDSEEGRGGDRGTINSTCQPMNDCSALLMCFFSLSLFKTLFLCLLLFLCFVYKRGAINAAIAAIAAHEVGPHEVGKTARGGGAWS